MRYWALGIAGAGVALFFLFLFLPHASKATGPANGVFENDCCGTLELRDGSMILNGRQKVRYEVGQDARGPYVLPKIYVGAFEDKGIELDGSRPTTRLRLDRLPGPTRILLYDGMRPFVFKRQPARVGT